MVNIDNFIMSQKLVCTKRLYATDTPWSELLSSSMSAKRLHYLGLSWSKFLSEKNSNLFWIDMFKAWYCYLNQVTFKATELLTVPLWYNSLISTQKIFFPHWYQAETSMPLDIIKPDSRILSIMELRQTFGLRTNFLVYHSIKRVLKR